MLIDELKKQIKELKENYDIVVLKGFPNKILNELGKSFRFVEKLPFNQEYEIDLRVIKANTFNTTLPNLTQNKGSIMFFETYLDLARNIKDLDRLGKKFIILENNLIDIYPNQSNEKPADYEEAIDSQNEIRETENFPEFYSESYKIGDNYYLRYIDGVSDEHKNVDIKQLIHCKYYDFNKVATITTYSQDYFFFDPNDQNTKKLIIDLLFNQTLKVNEIKLVVTDSILSNKTSKEKLQCFLEFLKISEIPFEIYKLTLDKITKETFNNEIFQLLKKYWGSQAFRKLEVYEDPDISNKTIKISQATVIEQIILQHENSKKDESFSDIFLTAPTGAGKSLLYQLPAIFFAEKYETVTIVISPLIALMKDQVLALKEKNYEKVAYLNSELSLLDREEIISKVKKKEISILYMSPELLLSYDIKTFVGDRNLSLLVIDEAHLVTTWGRDFRVDYWYLGHYIRKLRKYHSYSFVTLAVTATAVYNGEHDMVFETINSLNMKNPILYLGQTKRKNIIFKINQVRATKGHEEFKLEKTIERIREFLNSGKKSLIYCPWTTQIDNIFNRLTSEEQSVIGKYYGRLDKYSKSDYQEQFNKGKIKSIIATKAFGMGVDIDDIEIVYHHAPSGHLTDYVQEIGRLARKKTLIGRAMVDFEKRDLKFTKILYGLSSIKQYQLTLVLQKLLNIYKIRKSRNLLVTINDFDYIFNFENIDVEQKVKSSFLLIENDLLNKYKFNVIIARPKSLFTQVFIRVKQDQHKNFEKQFSKYLSFIKYDKQKGGYLYRLDLAKLWEKEFRKESFPIIKKQFFDKELFSKWNFLVTPQLKLTISLNDTPENIFNNLTRYFEEIENVFSQLNGFFTKNELVSKLSSAFDQTFSQRIANLLLSIYSTKIEPKKGFRLIEDTFIQKRHDDHTWKYRIINRAYPKVKSSIRRKFKIIFQQEKIFETYIAATKDGLEHNRSLFNLAYIIEAFDLGTYEIIGGELPAIFIRINDPLKIERLLEKGYSNEILKSIEKRYKNSVEIMEFFFTNELSNNTRWLLIEDFFLGKNILDNKKKYIE